MLNLELCAELEEEWPHGSESWTIKEFKMQSLLSLKIKNLSKNILTYL